MQDNKGEGENSDQKKLLNSSYHPEWKTKPIKSLLKPFATQGILIIIAKTDVLFHFIFYYLKG